MIYLIFYLHLFLSSVSQAAVQPTIIQQEGTSTGGYMFFHDTNTVTTQLTNSTVSLQASGSNLTTTSGNLNVNLVNGVIIVSTFSSVNPGYVTVASSLPVNAYVVASTLPITNVSGQALSVVISTLGVNASTIAVVNALGTNLSVTFPNTPYVNIFSTFSAANPGYVIDLGTVNVANTLTVASHGVTILSTFSAVAPGYITTGSSFPVNAYVVASTIPITNVSGQALSVVMSTLGVTGSTVAVVNALGTNLSVTFPGSQYVNLFSTFSQANPGYIQTVSSIPANVSGSSVVVYNLQGANLNVAVQNSPVVYVQIVSTFTKSNPGYVNASSSFPVTAYQDSGQRWYVTIASTFSQSTPGWVTVPSSIPVTAYVGESINPGVRASTGITVQEIKDTGRTRIILSTTSMPSIANALNMSTFTKNVGGTITNGQTGYTVTSGKTFRAQTFYFGAVPSTLGFATTFSSVTYRVLEGNSPQSNLVFSDTVIVSSGVPNAQDVISVPDGLEFPGGTVIGVSHRDNTANMRLEWAIIGYEY